MLATNEAELVGCVEVTVPRPPPPPPSRTESERVLLFDNFRAVLLESKRGVGFVQMNVSQESPGTNNTQHK